MTLAVHRPYPGVALVGTERGSVLLGAPADAFKATKAYCKKHGVAFPRVLVAPQRLLVRAVPQFNPEFFLYDFLFVYGAGFKPDLAAERLLLVVDEEMVEDELAALRMTLVGPSREEMSGYRDAAGHRLLDDATVAQLADVAESMAIKKNGLTRPVADLVEMRTFDRGGRVDLLDGDLVLRRDGPQAFLVASGGRELRIDLEIDAPVVPFATLPVPPAPRSPVTFGVMPLGTRSGFDLSGPTTGFVIWVNGRAIIYDGPVGTRYLLESQGIACGDIDGVVLSHCHEDHMGAFVELILAGERPKVFTTEPIYRSALTKLASYFRRPEPEVATLLDYHRVTPGRPIETLGAELDFFYTVHAIPTIGLDIRMRERGRERRVQISGDTMHHEGLDKMRAEGVIGPELHGRMRHLVPDARDDGALFFADVGEAIIHGHPRDWEGNPNRLLYYHCPDNEHTRSFGHELAVAGVEHTLIEAAPMHPAVPGRLLNALRFLEIDDPQWLATILFRGRGRSARTGDKLVHDGADGTNSFTVIVSGTASMWDGDRQVARLNAGDFFGGIDELDGGGGHAPTVRAETPMELFEIDGRLFLDYVREAGIEETLRRISTQRPFIESAEIFRNLDKASKSRLARLFTRERHEAGAVIIEAGKGAEDLFLLVDGTVEIDSAAGARTTVTAGDRDNFFGGLAATPRRATAVTVRAATPVTLMRLEAALARELLRRNAGIRYSVLLAAEQREA